MKDAVLVPELPSGNATSPIDSVGVGSSSVMVTIPVPSPIVAFVALDSVTLTVSSGSSSASAVVTTLIDCVVTPGVNVSVPLSAV